MPFPLFVGVTLAHRSESRVIWPLDMMAGFVNKLSYVQAGAVPQ